MAHFYGGIQSFRSQVLRVSGKRSGITVMAASPQGSIETHLYHQAGVDMAQVNFRPWRGQGIDRLIYEGPVGGISIGRGNPHRSHRDRRGRLC